ncbi:cupredoxin domain-containing protein [Halorussus lipolyticus]|uniref:cupredoxin domain-containing protein n=1 Tax=Halorussus lipolyticus TaxID=3034024 RepID=UPI0023E81910|nr:plastocyanin/azurin family copper-binding protein [Halorussus sp. DT80]
MTPNPDRTNPAESTDEPTGVGSAVERRPLLKALGVGTALSLGGGLATGSGTGTATEDRAVEQDGGQIHPIYGYATPDAEEVPEDLRPDHEVVLEVVPSDPEAGTPPSFFFEPTGLSVGAGDVVQFTFRTPDHTVTAYHPGNGFQRRVPDEAPPFSSPVVNVGGAWFYRFDREGVYDVYCGPHHVFGMVGRLVVGDLGEDALPNYVGTFEGSENPPLLAPFSRQMLEGELNEFSERNENAEWVWLTPTEVLDADALDPTAIRDAGSVSFGAVQEELGHGGGPGGEQTTTA